MSKEVTIKPVSQFLAGRWQVPLALVAAVIGSVALYHLIPRRPPIDFDALQADVTVLAEAGDLVAAADAVGNLLALEPPLPPEQRAVLHSRMANLAYDVEQGSAEHNPVNLNRLLEHSRMAGELGQPATPSTILRDAQASQWLGNEQQALDGFRAALGGELTADQRRQAIRGLAGLLGNHQEAKLERGQLLADLLTDAETPTEFVWWALQQAVQDALDENDTALARELLTQHGDRLKSSDLKGYLDHLWARTMVHEGQIREAEPLVRWIDGWLDQGHRTNDSLDDFGHLPSLNRWLMGRIHLAEDQPQDALQAFDEVLQWQPKPAIRIAANIGRGLALGALGRPVEAREVFQSVVDEIGQLPGQDSGARPELLAALQKLSEQRHVAGDYQNAVDYLTMAAQAAPDGEKVRKRELFEELGELAQAGAAQAGEPERCRVFHEQAGSALEHAAELARLDEPRFAELLWLAAEEYDQAGRLNDVKRVLNLFTRGRAGHPRMPRVLLLMGLAHEGCGELPEALDWYTRVIDEFPRLEEAARAKVLRARAMLSLGPERYPQVEQALTDLLADGHVAPEADVFHEALLTLCELLYHQGRYAEAIGRLEDFQVLYPDDPERFRSRFMLANAHRRSAYALRDNPPADVPAERAASESRIRFQGAAEQYGQLLATLAEVKAGDETLEQYARLALFYRGDCLFELNDPESLEGALAMYQTAAARYEDQPAALTALVQIANVCLRRGDLIEAARALERARWLLGTIPADAFTQARGGSRADWEHFLGTVLMSDMFRDVLAAAH